MTSPDDVTGRAPREIRIRDRGRGVGYLLKDRVGDVEDFISSLRRVTDGGTVVDPEVVRQLLRRRRDPLSSLSTRERSLEAFPEALAP